MSITGGLNTSLNTSDERNSSELDTKNMLHALLMSSVAGFQDPQLMSNQSTRRQMWVNNFTIDENDEFASQDIGGSDMHVAAMLPTAKRHKVQHIDSVEEQSEGSDSSRQAGELSLNPLFSNMSISSGVNSSAMQSLHAKHLPAQGSSVVDSGYSSVTQTCITTGGTDAPPESTLDDSNDSSNVNNSNNASKSNSKCEDKGDSECGDDYCSATSHSYVSNKSSSVVMDDCVSQGDQSSTKEWYSCRGTSAS